MTLRSGMVKFFTMCPKTSLKSMSNYYIIHKCLVIEKGKLTPMQYDTRIYQSRTFAEGKGTKEPEKEEEIEKIKMPGFVHPETHNEEGYFTQKAHQQIEELKKRLEKPTIDNKEKKE